MAKGSIGTVAQVIGPVLDIRFGDGELPPLLNAIEVSSGERKMVVEVAQHIGDNVVRCIAMSSTDGLTRGAKAVDTGSPITVPVGEKCLGRIFNLLGEPVDNQPAPENVERWAIHRDAPPYEEQETSAEEEEQLRQEQTRRRRGQDRADYGADQQRRQAARRSVRVHGRWRAHP